MCPCIPGDAGFSWPNYVRLEKRWPDSTQTLKSAKLNHPQRKICTQLPHRNNLIPKEKGGRKAAKQPETEYYFFPRNTSTTLS